MAVALPQGLRPWTRVDAERQLSRHERLAPIGTTHEPIERPAEIAGLELHQHVTQGRIRHTPAQPKRPREGYAHLAGQALDLGEAPLASCNPHQHGPEQQFEPPPAAPAPARVAHIPETQFGQAHPQRPDHASQLPAFHGDCSSKVLRTDPAGIILALPVRCGW